jgi:hypothetical protein
MAAEAVILAAGFCTSVSNGSFAMRFKQMIAAITAACFLGLGLHTTASAGVIGTPEYLSATDRAGQIARIEATLSRADVQAQLVALGVDPADATQRIASLSDAELTLMTEKLDQLPAGGDSFLGVIGIVFIVLLILEITGVIDIFKRI